MENNLFLYYDRKITHHEHVAMFPSDNGDVTSPAKCRESQKRPLKLHFNVRASHY